MGRLIDQWMRDELPYLQSLLAPPTRNEPGIQQPEGATTFPVSDRPNVYGKPLSEPDDMSGYRPTGTFAQPAPPTPTFGSVVPNDTQAPAETFSGQPQEQVADASSTFQSPPYADSAPGGATPDQGTDTGPHSFHAIAQQNPGIIKRGVNLLMQHLGGEQGLDAAYQKLTGRPPAGLSRQEKGTLLMEFGLRTLAHNDGLHTGLEAIGQAGAETIGSARKLREQNYKLLEDTERTQEAKKRGEAEQHLREIQGRLYEAQAKKAEQDKYQLKSDAQGRLIRIDMTTGASQVVLGEDGKPIMAGADSKQFASEIDRSAYEGAFCEGLTGDAAKQCRQRAVIFSKGGAPDLAFPEFQRTQIAQRLMTMLENPDNKRTKYRLPDGTMKAWADMDGDEKVRAADLLVDRWDALAKGKLGQKVTAAPSAENNFGLSEEQGKSIAEGKMAKLSNGTFVAKRNGKLIQVDKDGKPL